MHVLPSKESIVILVISVTTHKVSTNKAGPALTDGCMGSTAECLLITRDRQSKTSMCKGGDRAVYSLGPRYALNTGR